MSVEKPKILIVEDDLDVAEMLNAYFNVQGYEVQTANWGEDAIRACHNNPPQLIILDIRLPDIDGYEVARRLRHNRRTQSIPILFLTEKRSRSDRLQGLALGADDYITKPFDVQELRLRVRNALSRASLGTAANPVTNLPAGVAVDQRLAECLMKGNWALLLVELRNLEHFRNLYGFVATDDVLRAISLMVSNAVRDMGTQDDFIGQFGPTEILLVTSPAALPGLAERIHTRLEQSLDFFYPLKDREQAQPNRLEVKIYKLESSQGPFADLETLKANLLHKAKYPSEN